LAKALKQANPYSANQVTYFEEWEEDFVTGMYPERNETTWCGYVDSFNQKILRIWSKVFVFANFMNCSLDEASLAILKLTMTRVRFIYNLYYSYLCIHNC
jgi:hypothetical protein